MVPRSRVVPGLAMLGIALGCAGSGPGSPPPSQPTQLTATSVVSYTMNAPGSLICTARMRWEWQPGLLTGSEGRRAAFAIPSAGFELLEAPPRGDRGAPVCDFTTSGDNLVPGTWTITVHTVYGPEARCDVTLRPGRNVARFRQGSSTCTQDAEVILTSSP